MPESKHRRKNRARPRPRQIAAQQATKDPGPSPSWVPVTGGALLGLGVIVILVGYLPAVNEVTQTWPYLGANWPLIVGFVLLSAGFGLLTRWR